MISSTCDRPRSPPGILNGVINREALEPLSRITPARGLLYPFASHRAATSIAMRSTDPVCHTNPKYSRCARGPK